MFKLKNLNLKNVYTASAEIKEELNQSPLQIKGQFPSWLSGTLVRNGPVNITINHKSNSHWLDGLAMLHAFSFNSGQVNYTNKFLRTYAYSQVFDKGSLDYDGFAVDPCKSLFKQFFTWFIPHSKSYLHNANVNVAKFADHYVALTETPLPVEFDSNTLVTLGVLNYKDKLPKKGCWESAHPHYQNNNEKVINYCIQYGSKCYYIIYFLTKCGTRRKIISKIPVQNPAYMHSFAVTKNYIILTEFPFIVKPLKFLVNYKIRGKPFISNFSWNPDLGTSFVVINRNTGQLTWKFKTKPFFSFHHINAYEDNNGIYLDMICYDNPDIIKGLANHFRNIAPQLKTDENLYPTRLERFRLSLATKQIDSEVISSKFIEFPRINEKMDGSFYKFAYMLDPRQDFSKQDIRPIYKVDMQTRQITQWFEEGCYPGEPIFVASPNSQKEDEGIILSIVTDQNKNDSFLLVLDAQTFQEKARASINHKIPAGLHGQFFAD